MVLALLSEFSFVLQRFFVGADPFQGLRFGARPVLVESVFVSLVVVLLLV